MQVGAKLGPYENSAGSLEYAFSQNGTLLTLPAGLTLDSGGTLVMLNRKGESSLHFALAKNCNP